MSATRGREDGGAIPIEAVVVAAGASRRMGHDKLEAVLDGRSVLRWSVEALAEAGVERIVIVTAAERVEAVAAAGWLPDCVVAVVSGGARRHESVAAGVAALAEFEVEEAQAPPGRSRPEASVSPRPQRARAPDPVVLVHDAARPLASPGLIREIAAATRRYGAAIPVMPVSETLKRLEGGRIASTVDRSNMAAAQTPQGVRRSLLERAYEAYPPDGPESWTDEASLLEACRIPVHAISGEATNLKVTVPVDLELAQAMLDRGLVPGHAPAAAPHLRQAAVQAAPAAGRIGLGTDSHPFGPGEPLLLGGLRIEGSPRLSGHSDGDVALHAVADALLGAAALGDLGRHFPADPRTPAGIDSRVLLGAVVEKVRAAGWRPVNVDMTIVASRPRLGPLLPRMGQAIASILGLAAGAVNVKASTGNLDGSEGAGRSISATAIVLLAPGDAPGGLPPGRTSGPAAARGVRP
jgi:2-C-methyl-D-erythritol 4-phosphate cytidylyltransferase/2-C-methyl-D-erythritol 2,4-cyclodiphosphate synthase